MPIDRSLHSVFGASKVAADVIVQEYGRYFGLATACFRGGTLTGPNHSAAELHGFLAYVMRCAISGRPYTVYGYKGKQVRDAIHSHDLDPRLRRVLPRTARRRGLQHRRRAIQQRSVLEAIELAQEIAGRELEWSYEEANRSATTSGGSATTAASSRTTPSGGSNTTSAASSRRSTMPTSNAGVRSTPQPPAERAYPETGAPRIRSTKVSYSSSAFSRASFDAA